MYTYVSHVCIQTAPKDDSQLEWNQHRPFSTSAAKSFGDASESSPRIFKMKGHACTKLTVSRTFERTQTINSKCLKPTCDNFIGKKRIGKRSATTKV